MPCLPSCIQQEEKAGLEPGTEPQSKHQTSLHDPETGFDTFPDARGIGGNGGTAPDAVGREYIEGKSLVLW